MCFVDKYQVFRSSGPTSPPKQPIHQQESDWLQGFGSPYTMSHTIISVPLDLIPCTLTSPSHINTSFLLLSHQLSPCHYFCFLSLGFYPVFPPGTVTLSLPASHRLGSKTGAGSREAINHQKHCIRALLQNKTTTFTQLLTQVRYTSAV